jgi:hypothetical protein
MSKPKKTREELISQITTVILENATPDTPQQEPQEPKNLDLREKLADIRKQPGVTGYILKDQTTAVFDLGESTKIVAYAMLASETFDSCATLTALFELGSMEGTLVECAEAQMLCTTVGDASVAVFMEKNADYKEIAAKLQAQPPAAAPS